MRPEAIRAARPWIALAAAVALFSVEVPPASAQVPGRDWALYKTIYVNGSFIFMPIVGIGGVPVAIGAVHHSSTPVFHFYVDKNSYRRDGDRISFDFVLQTMIGKSRLHADTLVDCSTRTAFMPTQQMFDGPLATGEAGKEKRYMKKPKVSGDLKAADMAYFCEGPNPTPIGASGANP